jgi:hypothetical protein
MSVAVIVCGYIYIYIYIYMYMYIYIYIYIYIADLRASWSAVGTRQKSGVTVISGWDRQPVTGPAPSDAPQLTRQTDVYSRERVCITFCMCANIHPYVCAKVHP